MGRVSRVLLQCIGLSLVCAFFAPMAVTAPKPLTPEKVHARILKRGLGNWVGVEVAAGAEFGGRIVSIDEQSFSLQLHNDPEITPVFYSDVVDLRTGISRGGFCAMTAVGVAGVIAFAVVANHEMKNFQSQMPVLPTQPVQPFLRESVRGAAAALRTIRR